MAPVAARTRTEEADDSDAADDDDGLPAPPRSVILRSSWRKSVKLMSWTTGGTGFGIKAPGALYELGGSTQVGTDTDWAVIETGTVHRCALKTNGEMWCWGFAMFMAAGALGATGGGFQLSPVPFTLE